MEGQEKMATKDTINKYFKTLNDEKFDELAGLFCEDARFSSPVNFKAQGKEEIKTFYLLVPKNYPVHSDEPVDVLIQGNQAAVLIDFKGKNALGIPVNFQAVDWITFDGDKIRTLNVFYDSLALSRSLKVR